MGKLASFSSLAFCFFCLLKNFLLHKEHEAVLKVLPNAYHREACQLPSQVVGRPATRLGKAQYCPRTVFG